MKRAALALSVLTTIALTTGGCSRAIKEGFGVATGAKGGYAPIRPLAATEEARPLGEYRNFELGTFDDNTGGVAPRDLWTHLPAAFQEALRRKDLPTDPEGKTLIARGTILYYETSDLIGQAFGPLEEVVARVELVDKASGAVLGEANCVGRSTSTTTMGIRKKAEGLSKGIVKWIDNRFPKETGRVEY